MPASTKDLIKDHTFLISPPLPSPMHNIPHPPLCSFPFPTSDLRSAPPCHSTFSYSTSTSPLTGSPHPTPCTTTTATTTTTTTTIYPTPVWKETARGVWFNGSRSVLSASYPPVQDFLAIARRRMSLPVAPSEIIFSLAALDVFYNRNDPAHWMFWSDEKKVQTARVVNRIALRSPQAIRSNVAWNGIPEYLFILSGLHGSSSLPVDKEWYGILNPSKVPPPSMSLRKRKPQPVTQTEPLETPEDEDLLEVEEPRSKRPRRSTRPTKLKTPIVVEQARSNPSQSPSADASPASTTVFLPTEEKDTLPIVATHNSSQEEISLSGPSFPGQNEPSLEQQSLSCRLSPTSDPLPVLGASPSEVVSASHISPPQGSSHTRNRSISQASSSQTMVYESTSDRRSLSVLSNVTVVEMSTMSGSPDDAIKADQIESDLDGIGDKGEEVEDEESGMVTRGRANKARSAAAVQGKVTSSQPTKPRIKTRIAK